MLGLPVSTEFNKRIPKTKFFANLGMSPALKRLFNEQVESIYWRNKIAPDTVNIAKTQNITEIEVFEVRLNQKKIDKRILEVIDRELPYHVVFVLSWEGMEQLAIGFKRKSGNREDQYKVNSYFFSDWTPQGQLTLELKSLNLASMYEGWLESLLPTQVAKTEDLAEAICRQKEIERLGKQIANLERRIATEKQFNVRVKLSQELRALKENHQEITRC